MNSEKKDIVVNNVMPTSDFKSKVKLISSMIADAVKGSMGPYGRSTVIQTVDNVYTTKDGWNIMNNLNFKDITNNSIAKMIINVAQSVVLKVGDGTTSSIVVANEMNDMIETFISEKSDDPLSKNITYRDIEDGLKLAVDLIIHELYELSQPITLDNKVDIIKKIALVSTNWDNELSDLIADIYKNTNNPIIKIQDSGTEKSYITITEGYDLSAKLLAQDIFMSDGECCVEEPMVLVFDHIIKESDFLTLYTIGGTLNSIDELSNPKLIIMAPSFEEGFITRMKATYASLIKSGKFANMPIIPVKYTNTLVIDRECVQDFTSLLGGVMITKSSSDFNTKYKELGEFIIAMAKRDPSIGENPQQTLTDKTHGIIDIIIEHHAGGCDKIVIDDKHIVASGLSSANKEVINNTRKLLANEIDKLTKDADAHTTLTEGLRMKKIRLGKLNCNMGTIFVGGYGDAYLKAKRDALDDATRACEAAFRNGYVCGGGIATIIASINAIKNIESQWHDDVIATKVDWVCVNMLKIIQSAFCKIYFTVLGNKESTGLNRFNDHTICSNAINTITNNSCNFDKITEDEFKKMVYYAHDCNNSDLNDLQIKDITEDEVNTIVNLFMCIKSGCTYDVINDHLDTEKTIINPVDVDIEIIKGCLRLVLISISSNQMLLKYFD